MSHVAAVNCEVRDLDVLRAAADRVGFEFREGQKTHKWYGRFLNDWNSNRAAVKKGYDAKTFGTCEHALRMKAQPNGYEVGVVRDKDDEQLYHLVYDSFGGQIEQMAGVDLLKLRNEVQVETTMRFAQQTRRRVTREQEGDQIRLTLRA